MTELEEVIRGRTPMVPRVESQDVRDGYRTPVPLLGGPGGLGSFSRSRPLPQLCPPPLPKVFTVQCSRAKSLSPLQIA